MGQQRMACQCLCFSRRSVPGTGARSRRRRCVRGVPSGRSSSTPPSPRATTTGRCTVSVCRCTRARSTSPTTAPSSSTATTRPRGSGRSSRRCGATVTYQTSTSLSRGTTSRECPPSPVWEPRGPRRAAAGQERGAGRSRRPSSPPPPAAVSWTCRGSTLPGTFLASRTSCARRRGPCSTRSWSRRAARCAGRTSSRLRCTRATWAPCTARAWRRWPRSRRARCL
mmetsp:Transcript_2296/g.7117  ORF Transcript_2296/g.7117 Transcript_2296/m.7117 type:complete len:225 (-) Transcript_2296:945-1619(-)